MAATKYFIDPFAVAGDQTPVPDAVQPDGSVSYTEGYGIDYELDPDIEPDALDVERQKFNYQQYVITQNIQQYQQIGVPNFISTSDNGGSPFPYDRFSRALYNNGIATLPFISLDNSNTTLPTDNTKWWRDNLNAASIEVQQFPLQTGVANGDIVYFDVTTGKWDKAIADGTVKQQALGIAIINSGFSFVVCTGLLSSYGPGGLTPGVPYYLSTTTPGAITTIMTISNIVKVGTAISATSIFMDIQSLASVDPTALVPTGSILLYGAAAAPAGFVTCAGTAISRSTYAALFAIIGINYGAGDGSTTFNVPNYTNRSPRGLSQGAIGGADSITLSVPQLPPHLHSYVGLIGASNASTNGPGADFCDTLTSGSTGSTGSGAPITVTSPHLTSNFIIKV